MTITLRSPALRRDRYDGLRHSHVKPALYQLDEVNDEIVANPGQLTADEAAMVAGLLADLKAADAKLRVLLGMHAPKKGRDSR